MKITNKVYFVFGICLTSMGLIGMLLFAYYNIPVGYGIFILGVMPFLGGLTFIGSAFDKPNYVPSKEEAKP